jgi:hypothetical protein
MSKNRDREVSNTTVEQARGVTNTNPLAAAVDAALAVLDDPMLTAEGRAKKIIIGIMAMSFATPAESAAMASELRNYTDIARGLRLNNDPDALVREAVKLGQRALDLSRPIPQPSAPRTLPEAMTAHQRDLVGAGWNTAEVEFACVELIRTKEAITAFDSASITTSANRRVERVWLRSVNAPREEPFKSKFLAQFPPISGGEKNSEVKEDHA